MQVRLRRVRTEKMHTHPTCDRSASPTTPLSTNPWTPGPRFKCFFISIMCYSGGQRMLAIIWFSQWYRRCFLKDYIQQICTYIYMLTPPLIRPTSAGLALFKLLDMSHRAASRCWWCSWKFFKKSLIRGWGWFEAFSVTNPLRKAWLQAGAGVGHFSSQILYKHL